MSSKILIVDDEADVELLIRQRFRREMRDGTFDFRFARNGADALAALREDPEIEVVLTDINMPVMDGLTLLARLQERPDAPAAVVVSAYGDMANIRAAMNRGAFDFLIKPIDFDDFQVTVHKTLAQVRRQRAAVALERDLALAADIQRSFLPPPPSAAAHDGFVLHAAMTPAQAVGGDFYDYFALDDGRLGVAIGDVSGKGVPGALLMAVARTLLRAVAGRGLDPGPCLEEVNRLLLRDTAGERFVTLFYAVFDSAREQFCFANAGHNPPLLLRAGGGIEELSGGGLVVGILPGTSYNTRTGRLARGDRLFLYTDGIPEAMNAHHDPFGTARLREVLHDGGAAGPDELVGRVVEAVRAFTDGAPQSDDLTALAVLRREPDGGAGRATI